jgi:hypothetical protein
MEETFVKVRKKQESQDFAIKVLAFVKCQKLAALHYNGVFCGSLLLAC